MSKLYPSILYGLRADIAGNAHYVTDDDVLYLVGNALALHNFVQRRQRLVRLSDKNKISMMTVTPNKKYAALYDAGEKSVIIIYDLETMKKKKILGLSAKDAAGANGFINMSFTFDSKYLVAITNENQMMLFYNWERGKVESSCDVNALQSPISKTTILACNPTDLGIVAVAGINTFRFLTVSETVWRPYGFSKADNLTFVSMVWVNGDRLLAGTTDGRIVYLENGDVKNIFFLSEVTLMNLKLREDVALQNPASSTSTLKVNGDSTDVTNFVCFNRGFICALGYGTIYCFEKEGAHKYKKRNIYSIPRQISSIDSNEMYKLNNISINPSNDTLIVTTQWCQLFYINLWGPDLETDPEIQEAKILGLKLHHGPIGGLSICLWKPQVLSYGEWDRTVRLWDYEAQNLILLKQYLEDISCIDMHPTGLSCLVGFSDKLRFMSILIDDFLTVKEFSIRTCKVAKFSSSGHLFAAVNGNIVKVYSTIDFSEVHMFKGHIGIVKQLLWLQDDSRLISMGIEGAVYGWDTVTGVRVMEVVLKGVTLQGIVLSYDGVTFYCISSGNRIHEIKENMVIHVYDVPSISAVFIVKSRDDQLMLLTYKEGYVASLKYPLLSPVEITEYHMHYTPITAIVLTYDEQFLITAGDDATFCIWKIAYRDGKMLAMTKSLMYIDQILISRTDLGKKVQKIHDLKTRIKELTAENAYQMRQTILQHNDKMRDVHHSYCEAIEELRDKINKLEESHTNEINIINVDIAKAQTEHDEALRTMEINYDAKLITEYDKYQQFEVRNNEMRESYEQKLAALAKSSKELLESTIATYDDRIKEKDLQLVEAHEEIAQEVHSHEIIKMQIEEDADQEIVELRTSYESTLHTERQYSLKLKGEVGVLKNKYIMSLKDIEDLKWQINGLRDEYAQLKAKKEDLEKNLADVNSEVEEKTAVISKKDRVISLLESSNEELEKYKFVLNHRINELQGQIQPRDEKIAELKGKVADMETELFGLNKINLSVELQLSELREKLNANKRDMQSENVRLQRHQQFIKRMRIDLLGAVGLLNEPSALKNTIIRMHREYSDNDEFLRSHQSDVDAQNEFMKQRRHLENTIAILQRQIKKSPVGDDSHFNRLLEDNMLIIQELNALKDQLRSTQKHVVEMERLLGSKNQDVEPTEGTSKSENAHHRNAELELNYKTQIQECRRIIVILKENIDRLLNALGDSSKKYGQ